MPDEEMPSQGGESNPIVKIVDGEVRADSRDVATYFEKAHKNVLQSIKNLKCSREFKRLNFQPFVFNDLSGNEVTSHVLMTKDGFIFLAMGYTGEKPALLKEAYISRFNAMEARLRGPQSSIADLLANPTQLLVLTQGYALQIEDLKRDVSGMKQDVHALDRIAKADDLYGLRQAVQILQQPEKAFIRWLQSIGWCYRQNGSRILMAYAEKRPTLMTHKLEVYSKPDGSEGTREVLKFTTAGIVKLAKLLGVVPAFVNALEEAA